MDDQEKIRREASENVAYSRLIRTGDLAGVKALHQKLKIPFRVSALITALSTGRRDIIDFALEHADQKVLDSSPTLLDTAIINRMETVIQGILSHEELLERLRPRARPFHYMSQWENQDYATLWGRLERIGRMVGEQFDVNTAYCDRSEVRWKLKTPLISAFEAGSVDGFIGILAGGGVKDFRALLEIAESDIRNPKDGMPLVANYLIDKHPLGKALAAGHGHMGNTLLHAAAFVENIDLCRRLIAAGARCEAQNDLGQTPVKYVNEGGGEDDWLRGSIYDEESRSTIAALLRAGASRDRLSEIAGQHARAGAAP